jgi:hypothetical protein
MGIYEFIGKVSAYVLAYIVVWAVLDYFDNDFDIKA